LAAAWIRALYALLLSTENQQTLAAPMLRHIKAATAHWPERGQLYLQASALLCETDRRARGGYYVPWLAKEVYSDQITAFLASAGRFEDAYEKIRRDNLSLQERADYARMMLRNYNDMQSVATQIRAQTQRNVSSAEEAVEHYREKVIEQHFLVRRAEGDFRRGIERYQEEKKSEAIFEICMATLTLGETVGSIALGVPDPEAAQAAAQAGAEGSKLAKLMRKFAETMRKLAELMKRIGKFTKKVKNLAEIILMEGGFADEYRAFYFEPTPFSTWAVAVTDPGLDLNGVRGIVLEFAGNAIPKLVAG
jgi:hypothetical protein